MASTACCTRWEPGTRHTGKSRSPSNIIPFPPVTSGPTAADAVVKRSQKYRSVEVVWWSARATTVREEQTSSLCEIFQKSFRCSTRSLKKRNHDLSLQIWTPGNEGAPPEAMADTADSLPFLPPTLLPSVRSETSPTFTGVALQPHRRLADMTGQVHVPGRENRSFPEATRTHNCVSGTEPCWRTHCRNTDL